MFWNIIGIIAGILVSTSFIAQIWKSYKTKQMGDLSYAMVLVLLTGMALWLAYGLHLRSVPIIFANVLSVTFLATLALMKRKYST